MPMVRLHSVVSVAAPSAPAPGYPDTIFGDADADAVFSLQSSGSRSYLHRTQDEVQCVTSSDGLQLILVKIYILTLGTVHRIIQSLMSLWSNVLILYLPWY